MPSEVEKWLTAFLSGCGGSARAGAVKRAAEHDGHNLSAVERAALRCVEKSRRGNVFTWTLIDAHTDTSSSLSEPEENDVESAWDAIVKKYERMTWSERHAVIERRPSLTPWHDQSFVPLGDEEQVFLLAQDDDGISFEVPTVAAVQSRAY